MFLERTSSAKGPKRPPPFRPFSAEMSNDQEQRGKFSVKRRAASASTVTFKMQFQFNLSKPVISAHFQAQENRKDKPTNDLRLREQPRTFETKGFGRARKAFSAPSRSPGDLPMSVSFHQSRESMMSKRSSRRREKTVVGVVNETSVQQCRDNKKLFDDAVIRAESITSLDRSRTLSPSTLTSDFSFVQPKNTPYQKSSVPSTYSTNNSYLSLLPSLNDSSSYSQGERSVPHYARPSNCSIKSKTNGPTIIGSPIYNHRPVLAHDDRSNAGSPPTGKTYNHERYRTAPPAIRNHMETVSAAYKVVTPWHDSNDPPTHHILKNPAHREHIYLIPNDEDYSFNTEPMCSNGDFAEVVSNQKTKQLLENGEKGMQLQETQPSKGDSVDGQTMSPLMEKENGVYHADRVLNGIPEYDDGLPSVPVENDASEKNESLCEEPLLEKHQNNKFRSFNGKEMLSEREKKGEEKGITEGEISDDSSSLPSKPSSARYWKRQTWVDDVTVTSSRKSDDEQMGDVTPPEKETTTAPVPTKTAPNSPQKTKGEKSKADPQSPTKSKGEGIKVKTDEQVTNVQQSQALNNEQETGEKQELDVVPLVQDKIEVLNLNDLKKRRTSLPRFICPSSETKSREAAVRDWLETTSIHWAVKTSPLL